MMPKPEPQKEHQWLQKLVGEWTYEHEVPGEDGQPPKKVTGTESVRSLGGIWVQGEGRGEMPGGEPATMLITIGFDPQTKRFVGTWVGSMMTKLWVYDGWLDETGNVLTLESEGPDFSGAEGKTSKYRDIINMKSDDHRVFTGNVQGEDGKWNQFMETHYHRKK
ncbi:MAG TPA: DUF1579 domain-containing protein [Thermoanaerobaculia bacterium]|nr:DUF1579 domain-containing protein [Thermoanaerobaculia bacterium]